MVFKHKIILIILIKKLKLLKKSINRSKRFNLNKKAGFSPAYSQDVSAPI
jgi:hypothetical protein